MKTLYALLRICIVTLVTTVVIYFVAKENEIDLKNNYTFWGLICGMTFLAIAFEICLYALNFMLFNSLSKSQQISRLDRIKSLRQKRINYIRNTYLSLLGSKPIEEEDDIILDHNYDGIKELDNNLPPWWLYGFYLTILFAFIYMIRFHVFNDYTQDEEFETEMAHAEIEIANWKKTAKNLVDINTVEVLSEPSDLSAGRTIYMSRCIACHKNDGGGGIGPNLTDSYWLLGGGIKNIFKTISEGGRDGKGMISWKSELKPIEIAQVASYVLSLQNTNPADGKAPEGTLWVEEETEEEKTN